MDKTVKIVTYLILLALKGYSAETNYRFRNFGYKDGLTDKYIYCAVQDTNGYMWFGTVSGLYRYDGHTFLHVNSTIDKPGRSTGNVLQALYSDQSANLWLGSLNTLQWYNPVKRKFWSPDFTIPVQKKLAASGIIGFSAGNNGKVLINTISDYFFCFNPADSTFTHFDNFPGSASKSTLFVLETAENIYAVHREGIYAFSKTGNFETLFRYGENQISKGTFDNFKNRIIIVTTNRGIISFDLNKQSYSELTINQSVLEKENLFTATVDGKGNIFAGGYNLYYISEANRSVKCFEKKKNDEFEILAMKIGNLYFDREGNLWICSHFGLSMLCWQNRQILEVQLTDKISKNTVEPIDVFDLPENKLLITNTSASGLIVYNYRNDSLYTVFNPYGNKIEEKRIIGVVKTPDKKVLLTDGRHFFDYNHKTDHLSEIKLTDHEGKPVRNVIRGICDKKGIIYLESLENGYYKWDYSSSGKITHISKSDILSHKQESNDNILCPELIDKQGNVWFSSTDGVFLLNPGSENYTHLKTITGDTNTYIGDTRSITEDNAGHVWVASTNGLFEIYTRDGTKMIKNYNKNSGIGLLSDYCYKILNYSRDSSLFISSLTGIVRFDPALKQVRGIFTKQNGLSEDDGGYTLSITQDNHLCLLYFGKMDIIDLNTFRFNERKPVVKLNSITIDGEDYLPVNNSELKLSHTRNFISFEFSALIYNNANRNRYSWKLDGLEENWKSATNQNFISYNSLKPGKYTFRVKAANNDGVWGKETTFDFRIVPAFYVRWWFIHGFIFTSLLLIILWNRLRLKRIRDEEQLKAFYSQQLAESEMKALRAQMNPHFIFNSLNSIQKYILKNEQLEASQYLTKFSRLIRLILDFSNNNYIPLSGELDLLKLYIEMESLRFENKFDYIICVDEKINPESYEIPSMLIQPFVENAIWHGLLHKNEKGVLKIRFTRMENGLEITIEDNGIGRKKAEEIKSRQVIKKISYGISITEDRIAILNSNHSKKATVQIVDLVDEKDNPSGTKVILHIPFTEI